jgi:excisionase family DNA binding protein
VSRPPRPPVPQISSPRQFLTVADVAVALQVSPRTVWRLIADGAFPVLRVGRRVRIDPAALDAFIQKHSC